MADGSLDQVKHAVTDIPVEELMLRRWSPRAFADKPVSDDDLRSVFMAASWAASSYNEQPWRFVVGKKGDATYQKILGALVPLNQEWAVQAPVLYATFMKKTFSHSGKPNGVAMHDVGAASANLSLEATALGLRNLERVVEKLVPATSRTGEDFTLLQDAYKAVLQHRGLWFGAVAKQVGGVKENRILGGRDGDSFSRVSAGTSSGR